MIFELLLEKFLVDIKILDVDFVEFVFEIIIIKLGFDKNLFFEINKEE